MVLINKNKSFNLCITHISDKSKIIFIDRRDIKNVHYFRFLVDFIGFRLLLALTEYGLASFD